MAEVEVRSGTGRKKVRWMRILASAALAIASFVILTIWRSDNAPSRAYVSPQIFDTGLRFAATLPIGWEVKAFSNNPAPALPNGIRCTQISVSKRASIWPPAWLARLVRAPRQAQPFMTIMIFPQKPPYIPSGQSSRRGGYPYDDYHTRLDIMKNIYGQTVYVLNRDYYTPDGKYRISVQYYEFAKERLNADMDDFASTVRLVRQ